MKSMTVQTKLLIVKDSVTGKCNYYKTDALGYSQALAELEADKQPTLVEANVPQPEYKEN